MESSPNNMNEWFRHILEIVYSSETGKKSVKRTDYMTLPIPVLNKNRVFLVVSFADQIPAPVDKGPFLYAPKATVYISVTDHALTWRQQEPPYFGLKPKPDKSLGQVDRSHIRSTGEWEIVETNFYNSMLDLIANEWLLGKNPNPAFEKHVALDLRETLTILEDDVLMPYYRKIRGDLNNWIMQKIK